MPADIRNQAMKSQKEYCTTHTLYIFVMFLSKMKQTSKENRKHKFYIKMYS